MESVQADPTLGFHVVAMPYPGRGHVNPMMNLCKLLASRKDRIAITFVVTEEWLGILGSEPKPSNVRFATVPNVIPSEIGRGADLASFYEAVMTKLQEPFETLSCRGWLASEIGGIFRLLLSGRRRRCRSRCYSTSILWCKTVIYR